MITPIDLEELLDVAPIAGPLAAQTVSRQTDPTRRRIVWFLQTQSHQEGGLKKLAYDLLRTNGVHRLGSPTMHRIGFDAHTYFAGEEFESICDELGYYPLQSLKELNAQLQGSECSIDFEELISDPTPEQSARWKDRQVQLERTLMATREKMQPKNRRASAATFLYYCRQQAAQKLAGHLAMMCSEPSAQWSVPYFHDVLGALEDMLCRHAESAKSAAASTQIAGFVEDALNYAYRHKALVIVKGTERLGKTEAARRWVLANPDKARLVSLTAGTTDGLFYGEIFDALGCGEKGEKTNGELRAAIRATVKNNDLVLVIDEAHCLFGLSHKASIKRLEYIRTEFVNRNIPVVLIITPQFASRLTELERQTEFNVNQFRGRVMRWAELPGKPDRRDVECLCRFYLPEAPDQMCDLLTTFAFASEYPFAAVKQAITEAQELVAKGTAKKIDETTIKRAIGVALYTTGQVAATLPGNNSPGRHAKRQKSVPSTLPISPVAAPVQGADTSVADRGQRPVTVPAGPDFSSVSASTRIRTQTPISV